MSDHIERETAEHWVRDDLERVCWIFGHSEDTAAWVADTFAPLASQILARQVQTEIGHMEAAA
ncbi:hypothetical protein [Nocardia flavorosea]|uniref:Uncharacterized protein n=1 Tax=Nocardia flavorosea TaxID=53429 RepID=A0A846YT27_9NOCA|nr:hypothetical protein [Nocardia flavorosea]NKY60432.1 hypothetical protein [Nocardia flavorosea]